MHKEFEIYDAEVIIRNDHNKSETRELTHNIRKILLCENNIEEIEKLLIEKYKYIEEKKKIDNIDLSNTAISVLQFVNTIINFAQGRIIVGFMWALCCSLYLGNIAVKHSKKRKIILANNKNIEYLTNELEKERTKLAVLEKEKNDDFSSFLIKESDKKLYPSQEIRKLRSNLYVINDYNQEKNKYIRWFKNGVLREKIVGYEEEEIDFLEQLILLDNPDIKVKEKEEKSKNLIKNIM